MARPSSTARARRPHNGPGGVKSQALSAARPGRIATRTTRGKNIADRGAGAINGCAGAGTETASRKWPPDDVLRLSRQTRFHRLRRSSHVDPLPTRMGQENCVGRAAMRTITYPSLLEDSDPTRPMRSLPVMSSGAETSRDGGAVAGIHSYRHTSLPATRYLVGFRRSRGASPRRPLFWPSDCIEKSLLLAAHTSRAHGRGGLVRLNKLVAHKRDLPSVRRPAGNVDRPLTAEESPHHVNLSWWPDSSCGA